MQNFFNTPDILGERETLVAYLKTHTPTQMESDIRASRVNPNDLPALGDLIRMFLPDEDQASLPHEGLSHAKVLYGEGIRQLEANPALVAKDVSLLDAKWSFVACCLDLKDVNREAYSIIQNEPRFVSSFPDLSFSVAFLLWGEGRRPEAAAIVLALERLPAGYLSGKFDEAGVPIEAFEKLKQWVSQQKDRNRPW